MGYSRRQSLMLFGAAVLSSCNGISKNQSNPPLDETASAGSWSSSPSLPFAAQEIYPCEREGALHLAGGFIAQNGQIMGPTSAHHFWRPGDASWTEGAPLPVARHHPHLISYKGRLLALAGFESVAANAAWVMQQTGWQLIDEEWEAFPALPAPCAEAVLAETGDGALHMAGGRTPSGELNEIWNHQGDTDHHFVLTDLSASWDTAAPCLTKRNSTAGAVIDGNLHIVGGRTVGGGNVATHEVYDYREDRWRMATPMPQAQGGLAAASLGGKLYAFGGEYFNNGGGVYPEAWMYDPEVDAWGPIEDMPSPRHGLGAVTLGDAIYVIGGALKASGVDTSALVEVYRP